MEQKLKNLIKDLKEEVRENVKERNQYIKQKNLQEVLHLYSVNDCLGYVIGRLENEVLDKNNI